MRGAICHIRPPRGRSSTRTRTPRSGRFDAHIPYSAVRWHSYRIHHLWSSSHLSSYSDLSNKKTPFARFCERRSEYDRWLSHLPGDLPVGIGTWRGCAGCRGFKGPNPSTALDAVWEATRCCGRLSIAHDDCTGAWAGCHAYDVVPLQPLCDRWPKPPAFREECA